MTKPNPDSIDIDTGAEQRHGGGVSNRVRANALGGEARRFDRGISCVALD